MSNPAPARPRFVRSADGARIAYRSLGTGSPALVLVHGWSCDRGYWDAQLAALSRQFRVVAIDLAGHGDSDCGRQEWSIESFGGDVAAVADHLALEEIVLVGHSMGGDVILEAARRLPGRVVGLVWVDTYGQLPHARTNEQIDARMAPFRIDFAASTRALVRTMFGAAADPALVERIAFDMAAAPPGVALPAMAAAWTFGGNVPALLAALRLPLVAINPDDSGTDVESLGRFGIDVMPMPGVGHFPMLEDPQAFNDRLVDAVRIIVQKAAGRDGSTAGAGIDATRKPP
jgi:pimeloyl-ACP methyl ester carboxylesterase